MQIILQTCGKSVIEDMALLLAWRGRNVGILQHGSSWSAEYCQRMWCWMIAGGGGGSSAFIGLLARTPENETWNGAPTVLILKLSKHAYGRQILTPPTTETKGERLPLHKISLASELVLRFSRWLKRKIEVQSREATNKKKNGGILKSTYRRIKENVRNVWVEHQNRCVCVCLEKGKAFSVLSVGGTSPPLFFLKSLNIYFLNIISIYKMHATILYTVISFLQTQKSRAAPLPPFLEVHLKRFTWGFH